MRLLPLMLMMLASACATVAADSAVCQGTAEATAKHAASLADSPHDASVLSGHDLIAKLDAGCGR